MSVPPGNGRIVLITGINGYIASVLGLHVLSKGYSLKGTSRSRNSAAALLDHAYKDYASCIEIFEVLDITVPGAFGEAVADMPSFRSQPVNSLTICLGVWAIHHTASPMDFGLGLMGAAGSEKLH